jgi:hypothetical protein
LDQCLRSGSVVISQPRQPEALFRGEITFVRKRLRVMAQLKARQTIQWMADLRHDGRFNYSALISRRSD